MEKQKNDEKCIFNSYFECPKCFFNWMEETEDRQKEKQKIECCFCVKHPNISSKELLLRKIDIIHRTNVSRFPDIIQHLIKHISLS